MTAEELFELIGRYPLPTLLYFSLVPLAGFLLGVIHRRGEGNQSPWKYFYSALVYLACLPGVLSVVLLLYSTLILRQNLLHVNIFVYFLPLVSMLVSLAVMARTVSFDSLPGFGRLSGLLWMLSASFVLLVICQRMFLVFFITGGPLDLLIMFGVIFLVIKFAAKRVIRSY